MARINGSSFVEVIDDFASYIQVRDCCNKTIVNYKLRRAPASLGVHHANAVLFCFSKETIFSAIFSKGTWCIEAPSFTACIGIP